MPAIFTEERKKQIRKQLLDDGRKMLLKQGITKMNLNELARKAGIAKGTFYHFFPSKQEFILEIIHSYQNEKIEELKQLVINKQEKLTLEETKVWYKTLYRKQENPILHFQNKDLQWLLERIPVDQIFRPEVDIEIAKLILSMIDGLRDDIDYAVLANFPKMMSFAIENKEFLHEEALSKNIELIIDCMYRYIKGEVG